MGKAVGSARRAAATISEAAFGEVLKLIQGARQRVAGAANAEVI